jgi:hypothetical protein
MVKHASGTEATQFHGANRPVAGSYRWETFFLMDRAEFFKGNSARYFELSRLSYFDPVRMTVIDPMHNILLGASFLFSVL